jgi:phage terminase small subunit
MSLPKRLTEMQQKFAELLVFNEGRKTPTECAIEAGYDKDSAHVRASELRNPNKYPGVVKYIGELREEIQKKYEITFEKHVAELAKLRDSSRDKGAWSAAINAEVARGKAAGLYVEQKIIRTGKLEDMSEKELEAKMKQLIEDHKGLIVEADFNLVNDKQIEEVKEEEVKQSDSI